MKEPLKEYMKVGIVQFMIYPDCFGGGGPQAETLTKLVTNPFFDFIEVGPVNSSEVLNEMASIFSQSGVEAVFDGQPATLIPGLNLESEDKNQRKKAIDAMKGAIDQAYAFNSKTCGVMSGKAYPEDLNYAAATDRLVDSLVELCAYAEPYGITLCLENFDRVPYSKDCLIGPTPEARKLSERVRKEQPNFGLLPDLSHTPIMDETPKFMVEQSKGHIVRTQIGNGSANPYSKHYGDNHAYFGAPQTGVSIEDLASFLRTLMQTGYLSKENRGYVGFEVKPLSGESSEAIITGAIRALEKAWLLV